MNEQVKDLIPEPAIRNWTGPFDDEKFYYDLGFSQAQLCINELGIRPDDDVWDIGCGCGRLAIHFIDCIKEGTFTGHDSNHFLVQHCIDNIQKQSSRFSFEEVDVFNGTYSDAKKIKPADYRFSLQDESMSKIICWSVFTHMRLTDCIAYIREFSRVLKKGGAGIVSFNLLNQEIAGLIDSGAAKLPMEHLPDNDSMTINPERPEDGFAHSEEKITNALKECGLAVKKIIYGFWSGITDEGEFHDIVVFEKQL